MDGYMSVQEAADYLGIGRSRVYHLIDDGLLEAEKLGTVYAIKKESVERRKATNPGPGKPKTK